MVNKKNYYYFWQYSIDFLTIGTLKSLISDYNKKEKYLGYYMKAIFEDLITNVINDIGKIPTKKVGNDYSIDADKLQLILCIDERTCHEFIKAILNYDLVEFDKDKKSYYLTNIERFIGSNKVYKKYSKDKKNENDSLVTRKQKRLFALLKSFGYTGSLEQFVSGADRETVKSFIEATMNSAVDLKEFFKSGLTKEDYITLGIDPNLFNGKIIE